MSLRRIAVGLVDAGQALEHPFQSSDLLFGNRLEETVLRDEQPRPKFSEFPGALGRQLDYMSSPILWVTVPNYPASGLQCVQEHNHGGFLDLDQFAEPPLTHPATVRQCAEHGQLAGVKATAFDGFDHSIPETSLRQMEEEAHAGQGGRVAARPFRAKKW